MNGVELELQHTTVTRSPRGTHAAVLIPTVGDIGGVDAEEILVRARDTVCGSEGTASACKVLLLDFRRMGLVATIGGPLAAIDYWLSESRLGMALQVVIDEVHPPSPVAA